MTELDLAALDQRLGALGVAGMMPLSGGASSLTFRGIRDDLPVVIKVAPPGHAPVGHRDVLRQARAMDALRATAVPVPDVLVRDSTAPPLFVMSMVAGESFEPLFDPPTVSPNEFVPQRYRNAARTLQALHALQPAALGFEGEPIVGAAAEVDRWCATLDTVDPTLVPGWRSVRDALASSVPAPLGPCLVHGDFRLGNLVTVAGDVTAVIDWEIWSVGDPRIDVGWFLINADPDTYGRPTPYGDVVPATGELAELCGTDVADVRWFMALACFKSAATWALIVKHNRRRSTPQTELEAMVPALPLLLQQATRHLG